MIDLYVVVFFCLFGFFFSKWKIAKVVGHVLSHVTIISIDITLWEKLALKVLMAMGVPPAATH